MADRLDWLVARPIAHRGLHGPGRPENSLAAARAARSKGFAVECDVFIAADGVPMVFHDHDMARLTGSPGALSERTSGELAQLRLLATPEPIPSVAALLRAVDGAVPIVMELKGTSADADAGFMGHLAPVIDGYGGQLALMSFDPWLIEQALGDGKRPVGLTAEGLDAAVLAEHRRVFDRGCAFVSFNVEHLPNAFVRHVREDRQAPVITWTVRDAAGVEATRRHADQMTFEGFLPRT